MITTMNMIVIIIMIITSLSLSSPTLSLPQHSKWESLAESSWEARQPQYWPWSMVIMIMIIMVVVMIMMICLLWWLFRIAPGLQLFSGVFPQHSGKACRWHVIVFKLCNFMPSPPCIRLRNDHDYHHHDHKGWLSPSCTGKPPISSSLSSS